MTDPDIDECLDLLADERRRQVLTHLRQATDSAMSFDDLLDAVHGDVPDTGHQPRRHRDELAIELHHTHLPKLAANGLVEFEPRSGIVRYHHDEQVERVLDALRRDVSLPSP